jgi:hypothetical protein
MNKNIIILCSLAAIILSSCKSEQTQPPEQKELQQQFQTLQDSMNRLAIATEEKFSQMTVEELITELEKAAMLGREPFNSAAFREIVKRKDVAETLFNSIKESSQKEYFKLMALKQLHTGFYAKIPVRISLAILTDALANSESFNAWGIPNFYWESSARAIIEYGSVSVPYLEKLLDDKRPAPVWGSEEVLIYEQYKFRVCDYALALINEINQKEKILLPELAGTRDSLIASYKRNQK